MPGLATLLSQARDSSTLLFNNLSTMAEQLDRKNSELDERERSLKELEDKLAQRSLELDEREVIIADREEKLDIRKREGERLVGAEKKVRKLEATGISHIHLVVGSTQSGKRYTLAKSDLQQFTGSLFDTLVNSQNTDITIARDHRIFEYVFDFIVTGRVKSIRNPEKLKKVAQEFAYFRLPFFDNPPLIAAPRAKGTPELMTESAQNAIKEWLPTSRFRLIYKATLDGFHAGAFHHFCDNKGPTLTIIRDKEYIFGGYSPISWESSFYGYYKWQPNCFIFTISNPHYIPPTRYLLKPGSTNGVYISSEFCSSFGSGCDLKVDANANLHTSKSYTNFPHDYVDTTGKGNTTFTGSKHFCANEVEVYGLNLD
eukprot:Phypoly_transcript_10297.p1 GENE.Phypoly_transcript_10297~~Phypoly_transcript_10297.p1  ORF type:complete len:371 (+),score=57.43 Phypoly_transcript_10297:26-1138(+)